jgi:perosamine synthetase
MSSGRAALWLILKAISRSQADRKKVIIPAYTCPAVASAVRKAGLTPVLCDINLQDFGYNIEQLESKIDDNVLGVVAVHLFGFPSNVDSISELCSPRGILVIEDAAQAFGNELPQTGQKLGLIGDAGFFSFGRGKPLSALHGGLAVTRSETIYESCHETYEKLLDGTSACSGVKYSANLGFYSLFSAPHLYWIPQMIPALHLGETIFEPDFVVSKGSQHAYKIVEMELRSFKEEQNRRMRKAQWFSDQFSGMSGVSEAPSPCYPYNRYPLIAKDRNTRDFLIEELVSAGVSAALFYPCPLNELPVLSNILQDSSVYQKAKNLSDTLVTLPVHDGVTQRDMQRIAAVVKRVLS